MPSTSTGDGFPIRCTVCGHSSVVHLSQPPGDTVCPKCGSFLWVSAGAEVARQGSFEPDLWITQMAARCRDDVLREISTLIAEQLDWTNDQQVEFYDAIVRREELSSTGIGHGYAVPHAKGGWINKCFAAMALVPDGIDFNALDQQPVHTIIMVASPAKPASEHLRFMERVSRFIRTEYLPGG